MHDFFCQGHTPRGASPERDIFDRVFSVTFDFSRFQDLASRGQRPGKCETGPQRERPRLVVPLLLPHTCPTKRLHFCVLKHPLPHWGGDHRCATCAHPQSIPVQSVGTGSPWAVGGDGLQRGCLREIGFKHTCRPGKGWCQGDTDGRGTVQMNGESLLVSVGASWRCRLHRGGQCLQHL